LKEVDPEGMKELRAYMRKLKSLKKHQKDLLLSEAVDELSIMVAQAEFEEEGVVEILYMPMNGIIENIAMLLAAGLTRQDVCKKLSIEPELVAKVRTVDINRMRRKLPEAIAMAADQKVMSDLVQGTVSDATNRADLISNRRRKMAVDVHALRLIRMMRKIKVHSSM
jgi:hypothetical protein